MRSVIVKGSSRNVRMRVKLKNARVCKSSS